MYFFLSTIYFIILFYECIICVNTKRSRYTNYTKLQQENEERRKEEN